MNGTYTVTGCRISSRDTADESMICQLGNFPLGRELLCEKDGGARPTSQGVQPQMVHSGSFCGTF